MSFELDRLKYFIVTDPSIYENPPHFIVGDEVYHPDHGDIKFKVNCLMIETIERVDTYCYSLESDCGIKLAVTYDSELLESKEYNKINLLGDI